MVRSLVRVLLRPALICAVVAAACAAGSSSVSATAATSSTVLVETASGPAAAARVDPRRTRPFFVDPEMQAAQAALTDPTFEPIGDVGQAFWATDDEATDTDSVRASVRDYVSRANAADAIPLVTVYGIPGRDCGEFSSGGLPDAASYRAWVDQIALGLSRRHAVVVLEPDAVASMGSCPGSDPVERQGLLRYAARQLTASGAWVYVDAGHSRWRSADDTARLLKRSGVASARGFVANVSNFRPTREVKAWAADVLAGLRDRGVTGRHYVVDTSRNGARPAPDPADWCNPVSARLGRHPKLVFDGPLDGYAWVKNPGESDGHSTDDQCHGGPDAGVFWPEGARRLLGLSGSSRPARPAPARAKDPRRTRGLFVDPLMPAARAGKTFAKLGRKAQALWITDYYPTSTVRDDVRAYTSRANAADKTPMLAVYAIPDRDCGLYSAGGFATYPLYRAWIRQVAKGLQGQKAIVVLEPDAVPFMGDPRCTDAGPRQQALAYAAQRLSEAGAWVYLDAGHSGWRTPEEMAPLLKASGIRYARGFSTNVGNYRRTEDEIRYAHTLADDLARLGLPGKHYVIETARNGAEGGPVDGDVCNPTWARIGTAPRLLFIKRLDGVVWIKHPGESDGPCNGGPASGEWWPEGALRLLGLG